MRARFTAVAVYM